MSSPTTNQITNSSQVSGVTLTDVLNALRVTVGDGSGDMVRAVYDTDNDGKVDVANVAESVPWTGITEKPTLFPAQPYTHEHSISEVTGLQTTLDGKQATLVSSENIKTVNGNSLLGVGNLTIANGVTDHGVLTGLADDDHTQYHNDARGDARYAPLSHTQAATTVTFTQSGAGASVSNVQTKLQTIISVKDFGATGDGTTDDRAAIVATQSIGKGVMFPAGVYRIASNLTISDPIIFCPGATIKPDAGVVVTIAGPVSAGEFKIFDASLGSFSLTVRRAELAWFGVSSAATAADNTTAFNAAHTACPSDGIELYFPPGQIASNSFVVTKGGVILIGHRTTTWLINNTTDKPCIDIDGASPIYWNEVHRLRIAQASGVTPVAGNCGVRMRNTSTTKITEISCFNFPAGLNEGFVFQGASMNHLDTLYATGCVSNGYRWSELSGVNCIDNEARGLVAISNGGVGFIFSGCEGLYGYNLNAYDNANGVRFTSGSHTNKNIFLESCVADMSASFNWLVEKLHSSVFTNIWGSTQKSAAVNTFASGLYISSADCYDIGITNSQFFYNNSHGAVLTGGATNIRFTGCLFGGAQGNGRSGTGSGLYLELCSDVVITGCRSRGNASNGVNIATTASNYILVTACNLRGNTGTSLTNTSTGTGHSTTGNIT